MGAAALALTGALLLAPPQPALLAIGDFLVIRDVLAPGEVIHVISGPDHRADYGIRLYQEGYGSRIFFTGGWCPVIQGNHAERGLARAASQGVPQQAIIADGAEVHSTYEEALRLAEFIAASPAPIRSVIVVSDAFHMRRARWTYRRVLGKAVAVTMAPVPFELSPYRRRWWTDEVSARFVKDEYVKLVYYIARYQLSWGRTQEWLATYDRD